MERVWKKRITSRILAAFPQKLRRVQRTLKSTLKLLTVCMVALVIASSTTLRYPSAPKSWCSGPLFFLPFSMPVKLVPCTVVTSNALRASNSESSDSYSTLAGRSGFETTKPSSVLCCLVWKPQSCNTVSAGQ